MKLNHLKFVMKPLSKKEQKKMDRFIHFTMAAAKMAIDDSEIKFPEEGSPRAGTINYYAARKSGLIGANSSCFTVLNFDSQYLIS